MNEFGRTLGVALGTVSDAKDPDGLGRVKVKYDLMQDPKGQPIETDWLQIVSPFAHDAHGIFFLPEENASALLAFADGDPNKPYVLGFLWNGLYRPPIPRERQQDVRVIRTKSGKRIVFDDSEGGNDIEIVDEEGNSIFINTKDKSIQIESKGDLAIKAAGTLTLNAKEVVISTGDVKAQMTATTMTLNGGENIKLSATSIDLN